MQPNRLEKVWKWVKPDLLKRWNKLTADEVEACEGQYDRLVETIRRIYFEGRSHITLEAEIRDWLNERVAFYERTKQNG